MAWSRASWYAISLPMSMIGMNSTEVRIMREPTNCAHGGYRSLDSSYCAGQGQYTFHAYNNHTVHYTIYEVQYMHKKVVQ